MPFKALTAIALVLLTLCQQDIAAQKNATPPRGLIPSELPAPSDVGSQLAKAITKVEQSVVAVRVGNSNASGVIISADGEVLTAAHVAVKFKKGKTFITLPNGTKHEATLLGLAHEPDMALLKIEGKRKTFPYATPIQTIPTQGTFCFAHSHPGGLKKGRPAQVRLGRIRSTSRDKKIINLIITDTNIQPGDSGGGLFDLSGNLLGLTSTAGDINTNRFSSMEVFHQLADRLRAGEKIGEAPKPSKKPGKHVPLEKKTIDLVRKELMQRVADKHHPTLIQISRQPKVDNKVKLTKKNIVHMVGADSVTLQQNGSIGYGMDDPALLKQLPPLPKNSTRRLTLVADGKAIAYGVPISKNDILVKWSLISDKENLRVMHDKQLHSTTVLGKDLKWDLAVLKCSGELNFNPAQWQNNTAKVSAGTLLMARDQYLVKNWGVACDSARPIKNEKFTGAMMHVKKISNHAGPYDNVIRHTLPLFAADACAPIFNFKGELVAIHIARASRSTGLAIPMDSLKELLERIRKEP